MHKIDWIKNRVTILLIALMISPLVKANGGIVVFPVEKTAVKSPVFSVVVNGQRVFAQKFKDIHYVHFAQKGSVTVSINCSQAVEAIQISPKQNAIREQVKGNTITFQLTGPGYQVLTLNNQERLFILSDVLGNSVPQKNIVSILAYGVDSSGSSVCTAAIQRAINETAGQKKILYFPAGVYKTGTIKVPSNAKIYLSAGALLKGSEDRNDYPIDEGRKE